MIILKSNKLTTLVLSCSIFMGIFTNSIQADVVYEYKSEAEYKRLAREQKFKPGSVGLEITDEEFDVMWKLCKAYTNSLDILEEISKNVQEIDPHAGMGAFAYYIELDALGIYHFEILGLYRACNSNLHDMLAVLRSCQLGLLSKEQIYDAVENKGRELDFPAIRRSLKERLPNFKLRPDLSEDL